MELVLCFSWWSWWLIIHNQRTWVIYLFICFESSSFSLFSFMSIDMCRKHSKEIVWCMFYPMLCAYLVGRHRWSYFSWTMHVYIQEQNVVIVYLLNCYDYFYIQERCESLQRQLDSCSFSKMRKAPKLKGSDDNTPPVADTINNLDASLVSKTQQALGERIHRLFFILIAWKLLLAFLIWGYEHYQINFWLLELRLHLLFLILKFNLKMPGIVCRSNHKLSLACYLYITWFKRSIINHSGTLCIGVDLINVFRKMEQINKSNWWITSKLLYKPSYGAPLWM